MSGFFLLVGSGGYGIVVVQWGHGGQAVVC